MTADETDTAAPDAPAGGGRRGRGARRKAREAKPTRYLSELDRGIPYLDLLSPEQIDTLHDRTMTILETTGIDFRDDEAASMWKAAGADVDGHRSSQTHTPPDIATHNSIKSELIVDAFKSITARPYTLYLLITVQR